MRAWPMFVLATALAAGGCAGYKLGPTNGMESGSRTVEIRPFANHTREPRITQYMANSFRKQLERDGTFRLETAGGPDILLTGDITRFDRSGLSYQTNDVLTPQEYTLRLTARVTAIDVRTGKTNLNTMVQGYTYIRLGNDQTSAERQAIPILTDNLARNAVSLLVDGTW